MKSHSMTSGAKKTQNHSQAIQKYSFPGEGGAIGDRLIRSDAAAKTYGTYDYASDLHHADMLWGHTLRSPHAHARIRSIDASAALAMAGVSAVLTYDDIPGKATYGLIEADQPVLAHDKVNYYGEPVALIAANDLYAARLAAEKIIVDYEILEANCDSEIAAANGSVFREQNVIIGDSKSAKATSAVIVEREYIMGMQDQAPLGPEAGLAIPHEDGNLTLYIATQWLHSDLEQLAPCLNLDESQIHCEMSGIGGAFGAREDLSVQAHLGMLALHTNRPIKMMYDRAESFVGHVHRHPARMKYRHGADANGRLTFVECELILDGGAYASTTDAVIANAASLAVGPYEVDNVTVQSWGTKTNNPPCGAMRGFGGVQTCFAYESQMDALGEELGLSPVEIRKINAVSQGSTLITGQVIDAPAPLAEMLDRLATMPVPAAIDRDDIRSFPGGVGNTAQGEGIIRGVGYGVGLKNICYSEGFDDYSTARLRLELRDGIPVAHVYTAAAEVGQGHQVIQAQIVRTELGVDHVEIHPNDTKIGSAGSSSASRQSYMTGGSVKKVSEAVAKQWKTHDLTNGPIDITEEFHHRTTKTMDPVTGQGDSHVQLALCVHRATVDVDIDLGLVKVVDLTVVQDVGKILNPITLEGQIHGGTVQGMGLAIMEEIITRDGLVANASFTDYLIPTILDVPPMRMDIFETADPNAPYGLRGAGEPPTLSATPAVVAAIRDATGLPLNQVPVRPEHLTGQFFRNKHRITFKDH